MTKCARMVRFFPVLSLSFLFPFTMQAASSPAMFTVTVSKDTSSLKLIQKLNLKSTLVRIVIPKGTSAKEIQRWLTGLQYRSDYYKLISGFEVDALDPLGAKASHSIAMMANKSTFVSTKLTFSHPQAWQEIFKQESKNPYLMTSIFGANALEQLQQHADLGKALSHSRVPFVHMFTAPNTSSIKSATTFWQSVASEAQSAQLPVVYMLLDTGKGNSLNYASIVTNSLSKAGPYLQWVGGDDSKKFNPILLSAKSLTVWRQNIKDKVKGYSYNRSTSPTGLYQVMGTSQESFTILSQLARRTQQGANAGVTLLGDAEDNVHTEGVLVSLAGTMVDDGGSVYLPRLDKGQALTNFNMLVRNASDDSVNEIFSNATVVSQLINNNTIGLFDYSTQLNPRFYSALKTALKNNKSFLITYNTSQLAALKLFASAVSGTQVTMVILGAEAQQLVAANKSYFKPYKKLM
ncbi:MAG: hypothetical protein P1U40_07465 [Coxiellaceae bacterium]|nr:hypothetical protein [Coxiellaceae bacterium]